MRGAVLPKPTRLAKPAEFAAVLKAGRRVGTRQLAVHLLRHADPHLARPARAGLVVSSKVGNSVVRHRVSRRLREQVRPLLMDLGSNTDLVIRALPAAASATSAQLGADLRYALKKLRLS